MPLAFLMFMNYGEHLPSGRLYARLPTRIIDIFFKKSIQCKYLYIETFVSVPPRDKPRKKIQPQIFLLPELPNCTYDLASASNKVKTILDRLGIAYEVVEKRGNTIKIDMVAKVNTWSNQRRKRRQEKRMQEETDVKKMKSNNLELNDMKNGSFEITENTSSQHVQSNAELGVNKVIEKNDEDSNAVRSTESEQEGLLGIQVRAVLKIFKKDNEILLETEFINGTLGKEGLHQIVQFIKNNWK